MKLMDWKFEAMDLAEGRQDVVIKAPAHAGLAQMQEEAEIALAERGCRMVEECDLVSITPAKEAR